MNSLRTISWGDSWCKQGTIVILLSGCTMLLVVWPDSIIINLCVTTRYLFALNGLLIVLRVACAMRICIPLGNYCATIRGSASVYPTFLSDFDVVPLFSLFALIRFWLVLIAAFCFALCVYAPQIYKPLRVPDFDRGRLDNGNPKVVKFGAQRGMLLRLRFGYIAYTCDSLEPYRPGKTFCLVLWSLEKGHLLPSICSCVKVF